ncbi:MAG TPA: VOC family protein [Nocardioides sp.]|uniref:VOC family protein n=1 Tax=Nocardioides sp. TaxID=35761 RepID=UPI002ED82007
MHINRTALSLNVPDVEASARFARDHFGFTQAMAAEGFVSLEHSSAGLNLVFLRTGLESFRPPEIAGSAGQGMLLAFVVDGIDDHFAQISAAGATVVTPPETEPWGERYCQFADDNGIVWQLVEWVGEPA